LEKILRWIEKEIVGEKVVACKFVAATYHYGYYIVSAEFDGDFGKAGLPDPLVLTHYFSLHDNHITRLSILHNKPGY
jgi:hypothetical protein